MIKRLDLFPAAERFFSPAVEKMGTIISSFAQKISHDLISLSCKADAVPMSKAILPFN
jgi:hypothetical protein